MEIIQITEKKKRYLDLLLLADEEERMIDRYLERGTLYVLAEEGVKTVCVVTDEGNKRLEIKNLATEPQSQGKGYGKKMIQFIMETYRGDFRILQVGTGDSPRTISFYEKCGFKKSHAVKNFFTDYYSHPIYEDGKQLKDMIYLQMDLP